MPKGTSLELIVPAMRSYYNSIQKKIRKKIICDTPIYNGCYRYLSS